MFDAVMSFGLSEEIEALRDMVRRFAAEEIAPRAAQIDAENEFPADLWEKFGALGLLGITVSGGGWRLRHGLSRPLRRAGGDQPRLGLGRPVLRRALEPLHQPAAPLGHARAEGEVPAEADLRRARRLARHVGAGRGSDVVGMRLRARKQNDGYVLDGNKMWITNGPDASTLIVYAKTDPEAGARGITAFIVERGTAGFSTAQKLDKLGMRGSNTCELVFQDCNVPFENVLGEEGKGVKVLMSGLDYERVVLAGRAGRHHGGGARRRRALRPPARAVRRPIGTFQLMQGKLADMYTTMNACRAYVYAVAAACDRGETTRKDSAGCILYAAEKATQVALEAIQCLGGNGYINDFATGRLLRDAKLYEIGAGTSEIRRMLIGREIFEETT